MKTSRPKQASYKEGHSSLGYSYGPLHIGICLGLLVLLVAACVSRLVPTITKSSPSSSLSGVQVLDWQYDKNNHRHMTKWLADQGLPVVLHHTPFESSKSAQWTPQKLKKNAQIKQVLTKKGLKNVFQYFATGQPLAEHDNFSVPKPFIEVVYHREKFFDLLQRPFDGNYYYSSGGIELLGVEQAFSKQDLESLTFRSSLHSKGDDLGQVNFWFGMENVTAHTHYDTSYNLHSISYGRKKFVLFPPEAHRDLKLHPCLHQFYRQTFTDVDKATSSDTIEQLNGIEVTLTPGEVLYIPPYWFHCVVTLETTISLNVWSQSDVYLTMENIYLCPLPFEGSWGREILMKALVYFWSKLAVDIFAPNTNSPAVLIRSVLERYKPLLGTFNSEDKLRFSTTVQNYCLKSGLEDILTRASIEHIDSGITEVARHFQNISPRAVLEINYGNYVEHTALRILGVDDIVLLPFYFKHCFNTL